MRLHRRVLSNLEVERHRRAYGTTGLTQGWAVGGTMRWCEPRDRRWWRTDEGHGKGA